MKAISTFFPAVFSFLLLCLFTHCSPNGTSDISNVLKRDSIAMLLGQAKAKDGSTAQRSQALDKAYRINKELVKDSLAARSLSNIAYRYLKLGDSVNFKKVNNEAYNLARNVGDTFCMGDTYWNYANFFKSNQAFDSAYYYYHNANLFFEVADRPFLSAKMLFGMSFIKGRFRDYYGSEVLIVEAIEKFKSLDKSKSLYASYDHLSTLNLDIKNYEKALEYHKEAQKYREKIKDDNNTYLAGALNNLGLIYSAMGDYERAETEFAQALKSKELKDRNPLLYARLLGNKAYAGLLSGDTAGVYEELYDALQIRFDQKNISGLSVNSLHLAEYFKTVKDTQSAIGYAVMARRYAKEVKNNRDYLASLKFLSELDANGSTNYLKDYIQFNDSLINSERLIQNKFTRIAYETGQYIEANKRLSRDKANILFIGFGVIVVILVLYYANTQRARSQKLELQTEQQQSNERIYLLTLKQQAKLEEGRRKERQRISEELHDGILGKLFGTRVGMGFLELGGDKQTMDQHKSFLNELQEIEKEVRVISHDLNNNIGNSEISFIKLIYKMLESNSKIGNYEYAIDVGEDITWDKIDEQYKVNIYRIIQESLQNTIKYAQATKVELAFYKENKQLVISIKDNGVGFVPRKKRKGIGLKNMNSRATNLNGSFHLKSDRQSGTSITIKLPL